MAMGYALDLITFKRSTILRPDIAQVMLLLASSKGDVNERSSVSNSVRVRVRIRASVPVRVRVNARISSNSALLHGPTASPLI